MTSTILCHIPQLPQVPIGRGHTLDQPFAEQIAERKLRSKRLLIQKVTSVFQFELSESLCSKVPRSDLLSGNSSHFGLRETA